ncbi:aminotransferase class I/II-fold pyridoxal phosphate-dependent enzyme, partial [Anaerotignum sp.]|uniref:aminotransferase class I/II-fold pyridoxal phosphate-dependent enzyme n=1 Tax=Anaerotignum sp. TaxID=2039241 RepID=UPI0028A21AEF
LPKKINQGVMEAKDTTDRSTSGLSKKAMEQYCKEKGWEEQEKTMRGFGGEKYRHTLSFAKKYLAGRASFSLPNGGVSLWIQLPEGISAEAFCSRMLEKNVILTPGSQFEISGRDSGHVRLSFCGLEDGKIEVGLKRMSETIDNMVVNKLF